jgi:hypothetical protein
MWEPRSENPVFERWPGAYLQLSGKSQEMLKNSCEFGGITGAHKLALFLLTVQPIAFTFTILDRLKSDIF